MGYSLINEQNITLGDLNGLACDFMKTFSACDNHNFGEIVVMRRVFRVRPLCYLFDVT